MAANQAVGPEPPRPYRTWLEHFEATVQPTHQLLGPSREARRRLDKVETNTDKKLQDPSHIHDLFHPTSMLRFGFKEVLYEPNDEDMMALRRINGGPLCSHMQGRSIRQACDECINKNYRYLYQ